MTISRLRDELRKNEPTGRSPRLLNEDWLPSLKRIGEPPALRIGHQSVSVRHDPGRVQRHYLFTRRDQNAVALELKLTLCLDGWSDTKEVVFRALESHQGHLPRPIEDMPAALGIGEFGFAWGYRESQTIDAVVFARCNVVVLLRRYGDTPMVEYAQDLERELLGCDTCEAYALSGTGAFAEVGQLRPVSVRQRQRLDLSTEPDDETFFYAASAGSVNRDPQEPRRRYFRAPSESTKVQLWAYALRDGMLAQRESLAIEVIA